MNKVCRGLFYQGISIPFWGLALVVVGLLTPGHVSLSQHLSVIGASDTVWAGLLNVTSVGLGASILLYSVSAPLVFERFVWLSLPSAAFGLAMVFNGLYEMGSPLHGLYGMAFFSPLVPVIFSLERKERLRSNGFVVFSIMTALIGMLYMWLMLTRLDPPGFTGLTQRIFIVWMTAWYGLSVWVSKAGMPDRRETAS